MEDNENPAGQEFGSDGNAFDVGASYSTGPWSVGITYLTSDTEGAPGVGDRELDSISGGVEYALGPGITTAVSVLWADMEDSAGTESEGILGIAGMTLSF
jgi:predicted porin